MKKPFLFLAFMMFVSLANAQVTNINVGQASQNTVKTEQYYYINGISSKYDIGGVSWTKGDYMLHGKTYEGNFLTNANLFTVTVAWESTTVRGDVESGTVTIKPEERVFINLNGYYGVTMMRTITRKLLSNVDITSELKKYKELLDNGIISQSEFDILKGRLLGI